MINNKCMTLRKQIWPVKTAILLLLGVVLAGASVAQSGVATSNDCKGPTSDVSVMALQDPDGQPSYVIVIKNHSPEPVTALVVGDGIKPELHVIPFAVPTQIVGPNGWTGKSVFLEG